MKQLEHVETEKGIITAKVTDGGPAKASNSRVLPTVVFRWLSVGATLALTTIAFSSCAVHTRTEIRRSNEHVEAVSRPVPTDRHLSLRVVGVSRDALELGVEDEGECAVTQTTTWEEQRTTTRSAGGERWGVAGALGALSCAYGVAAMLGAQKCEEDSGTGCADARAGAYIFGAACAASALYLLHLLGSTQDTAHPPERRSRADRRTTACGIPLRSESISILEGGLVHTVRTDRRGRAALPVADWFRTIDAFCPGCDSPRRSIAVVARGESVEIELSSDQLQTLSNAYLDGAGLSAASGAASPPPALQVVSLQAGGGVVPAGEALHVTVRVRNVGAGTLYRLRARTVSDIPSLQGSFLYFGPVGPGEEKTASVQIPVGALSDTRAGTISLAWLEANGYHAMNDSSVAVRIVGPRIEPVTVRYEEGNGPGQGNGDGAVQASEVFVLVARVRNAGSAAARVRAAARLVNVDDAVVLEEPAVRAIEPGSEGYFRIPIHLLPTFAGGEVPVQVDLSLASGEPIRALPVTVPVGGGPILGSWARDAHRVVSFASEGDQRLDGTVEPSRGLSPIVIDVRAPRGRVSVALESSPAAGPATAYVQQRTQSGWDDLAQAGDAIEIGPGGFAQLRLISGDAEGRPLRLRLRFEATASEVPVARATRQTATVTGGRAQGLFVGREGCLLDRRGLITSSRVRVSAVQEQTAELEVLDQHPTAPTSQTARFPCRGGH